MRWGSRARLVAEALGDASPVRVVACPPLAEVLAESGRALTGDGDAAALVAVTHNGLEEWIGALREGGVIVLVESGSREEAMRRALCAGLVELEQRVAGRAVVTSGRTRRLP
jgi:hypothetical protein